MPKAGLGVQFNYFSKSFEIVIKYQLKFFAGIAFSIAVNFAKCPDYFLKSVSEEFKELLFSEITLNNVILYVK